MFRLLITCLTITVVTACQTTAMKKETVSTYTLCLKPVEDPKEGIEKQVKVNKINAGWIATCLGCLTICSGLPTSRIAAVAAGILK